MIQPTAQKASRPTMTRPRIALGAYSLTSVDATGSSAPRPRPTKKRSVARIATAAMMPMPSGPGTRADAPVAMP